MAKSKRGLGKGLGALIPQDMDTANALASSESVIELDIEKIMPNKKQPRRYFDKIKLKALEDSIETYGLVQPIVVREIEHGYEIVAGERRWRASKNIGLKTINAIVRTLDELQQAQIALIENLQREDLNDIEEAMAYEALIREHTLTQQDVAKAVGRSRTYITNTLRLLKLDDIVKKYITDGVISGGHGRALLGIEDEKLRRAIADRVADESLSVRETEKIVSKAKAQAQMRDQGIAKEKESFVIDFETELQEMLGTKVNIKQGKRKGKIEIEYYNEEDLGRILTLIKSM